MSTAKRKLATPAIEQLLTANGRLLEDDLNRICAEGTLLEAMNSGGPKVVRCENTDGGGLILKLWYAKQLWSSTRLFPYSVRFRKNAHRLRSLNVSAPMVRGWGTAGAAAAHYVCYEELPGRSLRQWLPEADLVAVGQFVAELHGAGIDFRSLHMGNMLWDGSDLYSLVDVTDCGFKRAPLSLENRARRLIYLCTHRQERDYFRNDGRWTDLIKAYCDAAAIASEDLLRIARSRRNRLRLPAGVRQAADALLLGS